MKTLAISSSLVVIFSIGLTFVSPQSLAQSDMASMDGHSTQAQGGDAPIDARDPNAYADGTTLTTGPYALSSERQLKLADEHNFFVLLGDRLEYNEQSGSGVFDLQGWYGTAFNRLVIKTEGEFNDGKLEDNSTDILWGHAITAYWDTQIGVRTDYYKEGKNRQWLAFGFQGLAPYWFELDMTAYVGDRGNTAFTFEAEYELLLTQKLIIQPRSELNFYGKDDQQNELGSGLSSGSIGFRIRYEFTRQFAPYVGIEWAKKFGNTADYAQVNGQSTSNTEFVAGIKFWF